MLGALLQLGEGRDRVAGLGVQRVVHFQKDRAVPLHDQRIGGVVLHGLLAGSRAKRVDRISLVRDPLQQKRERSMLDAQGWGWQGALHPSEAVALYASASEFESPDLTPEGVPPKAADFS